MYVADSPTKSIIDNETDHLLLSFCTFCTQLKGKKLSLQNIFVLLLKEEKLRNILKDLLFIDNNYELVQIFLQFEPTIVKSKYITKYLNANKGIKL